MKKYEKKSEDFEPEVTHVEEEKVIEEPTKATFKIKVEIDNLNMRIDASYEAKTVGLIKRGSYDVEQVVTDIDGNEWGKIDEGKWVNLKFVKRV